MIFTFVDWSKTKDIFSIEENLGYRRLELTGDQTDGL